MDKPIEDLSFAELADTVCPFKPYRGQTFGEVFLKNPSFLRWVRRKRILSQDKHRKLARYLDHPQLQPIKRKRQPHWRTTADRMMRGL